MPMWQTGIVIYWLYQKAQNGKSFVQERRGTLKTRFFYPITTDCQLNFTERDGFYASFNKGQAFIFFLHSCEFDDVNFFNEPGLLYLSSTELTINPRYKGVDLQDSAFLANAISIIKMPVISSIVLTAPYFAGDTVTLGNNGDWYFNPYEIKEAI